MHDWKGVERGKQAMRRKLAAMPIAEKLRMLDALRERHLLLHRSAEDLRRKTRPGT